MEYFGSDGVPELHTGVQFSFSLKLKSLLRKYRKQIFGLWILILNIFDSKLPIFTKNPYL